MTAVPHPDIEAQEGDEGIAAGEGAPVKGHGQSGGGERPDPLNSLAAQGIGCPVQLCEGFAEMLLDEGIKAVELPHQRGGRVFELGQTGETLLQGNMGLHQSGPAMKQTLQGGVALGWWAPGPQVLSLAHQIALQQLGIAGISLGAATDAVTVAAEAVAIDQVDGVAGAVGLLDEVDV